MDVLAKLLGIKDRASKLPHKDGVYNRDWYSVKTNLLLLLEWLLDFSAKRGVPIMVTSIIRARIANVSVSDTHEQGRAFDISVRGWLQTDIDACVEECNKALGHLGAVSKKDGKARAVVFEDDQFDANGKQIKWKHLHFQCKPVVG